MVSLHSQYWIPNSPKKQNYTYRRLFLDSVVPVSEECSATAGKSWGRQRSSVVSGWERLLLFTCLLGRASPEVGRRYYESVVTALRAKRGSGRGTGGRPSAAWLRVSLLTTKFRTGLTTKFILLSHLWRWTEWALREHELEPPHCTTRTEGYWGRKRLGTDNYWNETLQFSLFTRLYYKWTHIWGNTYPLVYTHRKLVFCENTQALLLFFRWELYKILCFQLKIIKKGAFFMTDVRCIF